MILDLLFFAGLVAVGYGLSLWSIPLAIVYAGVALAFVAYQRGLTLAALKNRHRASEDR